MRHTSSIVLTATLPLLIGGCALFGGGDDTATNPSPTPVVVPTTPVTAAPNTAPTTAAPANAPAAGILPADLISSTDPGQRIQGIQRNRPDPFALVPTTPRVEIPPSPAVPQPVPQVQNLPNREPSSTPIPAPGSLAPIPQLIPAPSIPILPPPPQPDRARAVKVTGVVQIGDTLHAIVNAPDEPSSRYVRVGQRLSNGRVLVKRIEMNEGAEPVVVLEENGIEVITAVGEGGTPDTAGTGQPAA